MCTYEAPERWVHASDFCEVGLSKQQKHEDQHSSKKRDIVLHGYSPSTVRQNMQIWRACWPVSLAEAVSSLVWDPGLKQEGKQRTTKRDTWCATLASCMWTCTQNHTFICVFPTFLHTQTGKQELASSSLKPPNNGKKYIWSHVILILALEKRWVKCMVFPSTG